MPRTQKTKEAQRLEEIASGQTPETMPQPIAPETVAPPIAPHQNLGHFAISLGDSLVDNVASMAVTEIHRQLEDGRLIRKIEGKLAQTFGQYLQGLDGNAQTIQMVIEGEQSSFFLPSTLSQN